MKKYKKLLVALLSIITITIAGYQITPSLGQTTEPSNTVISTDEESSVYYLDVGQGNCIVIKSGNDVVMYDTGDNNSGETIVDWLNANGIESIDYLVGSHPDADHIGGMDTVILNTDVKNIYLTDHISTTKTYNDVLDAIDEKNLEITLVEPNKTIDLDNGTITFLAPLHEYDESNDSSVVMLYEDGYHHKFIFTGDISSSVENELLDNNINVQADVYLVAHHGSKSSNSTNFLKAVNPSIAIISVGENSYGHPTTEVINRLNELNIETYRTDEKGTIKVISDENGLTVETEK